MPTPKKTTQKTTTKAPKRNPFTVALAAFFSALWLVLRKFWALLVIIVRALWHLILNVFYLLAGVIKYVLAIILIIALSIFLLSLSAYFILRASGLNESSQWQEIREDIIEVGTLHLNFELQKEKKEIEEEIRNLQNRL